MTFWIEFYLFVETFITMYVFIYLIVTFLCINSHRGNPVPLESEVQKALRDREERPVT